MAKEHRSPDPSRALVSYILIVAMLAFAGCGGARTGGAVPPTGDAVPPTELDQSFSDFQPISIQGVRFVPNALERPGMIRVMPKRKVSLAKQRKVVERRSSPVNVQILATLLWIEAENLLSGEGETTERARALRNEALELLRAQREQANGKSGVVTLQMLASAEMWAQNSEGAASVYKGLLERFPEHERARSWKTWLAYLSLRAGRDGRAKELTSGWTLEDQDALGLYVMGWIALRTGDRATARGAMVRAVEAWPKTPSQSLQRELLLVLARTDTKVEEADGTLAALAEEQYQARYAWLYQLSEAYKGAGHYQRASETLGLIVDEVMKDRDIPPDDYVGFRFRQADYQFRQNQPVAAADLAVETYEALDKCGEERCPDQVRESVRARLEKLAVFYHTTYHSTLDERYYGPAKKLYEFLLSQNLPNGRETRQNLTNLEDTKARANPANGKHDQQILLQMVAPTRQEVVTACYEWELQGDPKLAGSLQLGLDITEGGQVAAVETTPGPDVEGMAAVAACVIGRARDWTFPGRSVPGRTRMTLPFVFEPRRGDADQLQLR